MKNEQERGLAGVARVLDGAEVEVRKFEASGMKVSWSNESVMQLFEMLREEIAANRPEWAEVSISEVLLERDELLEALEELTSRPTDELAKKYWRLYRKARAERDRARRAAVILEQELAALGAVSS